MEVNQEVIIVNVRNYDTVTQNTVGRIVARNEYNPDMWDVSFINKFNRPATLAFYENDLEVLDNE